MPVTMPGGQSAGVVDEAQVADHRLADSRSQELCEAWMAMAADRHTIMWVRIRRRVGRAPRAPSPMAPPTTIASSEEASNPDDRNCCDDEIKIHSGEIGPRAAGVEVNPARRVRGAESLWRSATRESRHSRSIRESGHRLAIDRINQAPVGDPLKRNGHRS